eukprot:1960512-Prymnesium_polylepis.3
MMLRATPLVRLLDAGPCSAPRVELPKCHLSILAGSSCLPQPSEPAPMLCMASLGATPPQARNVAIDAQKLREVRVARRVHGWEHVVIEAQHRVVGSGALT